MIVWTASLAASEISSCAAQRLAVSGTKQYPLERHLDMESQLAAVLLFPPNLFQYFWFPPLQTM